MSFIMPILIDIIINIFKFILYVSVPFIVFLILLYLNVKIRIVYFQLFKKYRRMKDTYKSLEHGFFYKIFVMFPKIYIEDYFSYDPCKFSEYGIHLWVGEQGAGKTLSMVYRLTQLQKKYEKLKVRTNFNYKYQDDEVIQWQDLCHNDNGEFGQVEAIDELSVWFSSNYSKNFSVDMLAEVSQQRKQRKCIFGTAQVFCRLSKPIREQTHYVYIPTTYFGCLTRVKITKPYYYDSEKDTFKKYIGSYFFVHTKELRESYDTYKKIDALVNVGFKDNLDTAI